MNLSDALVSGGWLWAGQLVYWPALLLALARAPWFHLRESESLHVLLAGTVAVLVLWTVSARIGEGISLHLLGATVVTLMFGWQFAILCLSTALLGVTLNGDSGWLVLPLNGALTVAVPVAVSRLCHVLAERLLPPNFFVYIFASAFFAGAAAMLAVGAASTVILAFPGEADSLASGGSVFPFFMLLTFPEAFITGMLMTLFVSYRPQWVSSFRDERYLKGR